MPLTSAQLEKLRRVISESLRVQQGMRDQPEYIDIGNKLADATARQNHVIFGRRGCGKTLLLNHSRIVADRDTKFVYLNCEDFKNHSFPNVLIEILVATFNELSRHLSGWFGRKRKCRAIITGIIDSLNAIGTADDTLAQDITIKESSSEKARVSFSARPSSQLAATAEAATQAGSTVERSFSRTEDKLARINSLLPRLKSQLRDLFAISGKPITVLLQIDDFYHLRRSDQPYVADYIHRLCKDLPLFFKLATLRHASALYVDRDGQPIGAQERHDYQPIDVDFTLGSFTATTTQNWDILCAFASHAGISRPEVESMFRGEGWQRLVIAGGGVPRDVLSLLLAALQQVQTREDPRIGKDDIRALARTNLEQRIQELKHDSEGKDQDSLLRGIYALRQFCLNRELNVFFVPEKALQQHDEIRSLLFRLLDYRIIHSLGGAHTHKSQSGTFHAFMIDIGVYAHMRKLEGKFAEIDVASTAMKEAIRSSPILTQEQIGEMLAKSPNDPERALLDESA